MAENGAFHSMVTRRRVLATAGAASLALSKPAWAQTMTDLPLSRRSRSATDHERLSTEGADDPAADPSAAPGNAVRSFRQRCIHPKRSILRALALGDDPDRYRYRQVQLDGAWPRESNLGTIAERYPPWIAERPARRGEPVFGQFPRFFSAPRIRRAMGERRHGQRALDRGPSQGRARQGWREARRGAGAI